jgi:hypothetical protein
MLKPVAKICGAVLIARLGLSPALSFESKEVGAQV